MEYIIGILLLISFVGLAVYAVRGGNLMMGMLIMAIIWTVLPLIGNTFATNPEFIGSYPGITDISVVDAITKVFQSGPEGWGNVLVNVVFGAWFGRVLLQTGIADALIRKAVELGGDKPVIICVLLSTVTTAIFSTLFGAGAVVAIGVIILPILMSLGIPKTLSIGSFMMSVGAGMYLNPVLTGQFLGFFLGEDGKQLITYDDPARLHWAIIGVAVQLLVVIVMCVVTLGKKKTVHAWSASAARKARPGYVPTIALIAPIIQHCICNSCATWTVPWTIYTVRLRSCNTWNPERNRIPNTISVCTDGHSFYYNECINLYDTELDRMGSKLLKSIHKRTSEDDTAICMACMYHYAGDHICYVRLRRA